MFSDFFSNKLNYKIDLSKISADTVTRNPEASDNERKYDIQMGNKKFTMSIKSDAKHISKISNENDNGALVCVVMGPSLDHEVVVENKSNRKLSPFKENAKIRKVAKRHDDPATKIIAKALKVIETKECEKMHNKSVVNSITSKSKIKIISGLFKNNK